MIVPRSAAKLFLWHLGVSGGLFLSLLMTMSIDGAVHASENGYLAVILQFVGFAFWLSLLPFGTILFYGSWFGVLTLPLASLMKGLPEATASLLHIWFCSLGNSFLLAAIVWFSIRVRMPRRGAV